MNASESAVRPPGTRGPVERFLDYDQSLACIHCGLCLASCPTYLETGNENDSPRGRIYLMRALQEGRQPLEEATVRHIDLCLGFRKLLVEPRQFRTPLLLHLRRLRPLGKLEQLNTAPTIEKLIVLLED